MTGAPNLRDLLPRTFGAFLGRFSEATPIQERGIPPILAGRDVLLCAPTASGKTEAYTAPLVERLTSVRDPRGGADGFRMLLVSPTRALGNDLKRRLDARMEALQVTFGRYTGEHKERLAGRLPAVAVTTPEALDSMLARRPQVLAPLQSIVLDEIHVLDGTPRGDQLAVLLHRLDRAAQRPPQRVAASATVADPPSLAARYLRDAEVVSVPGVRSILARAFQGTEDAAVARHLEELASGGFRKILIFCNRRNDVESLAHALLGRTRFGAEVYAHHGSVARTQRERIEKRFLEAPAAVVFATLTLELGIDIGDVDYVLCHRAPPGVASLLQRLGRGNRRSGATRVGYCIDGEADRLLFETMLRAAARGELCAPPYAFRAGVLVQQAIVIAGGTGWVTADLLHQAAPPRVQRIYSADDLRRVLEAAASENILEFARAGRYVLSDSTQRLYDRGVVHSNLDAESDAEVVDRLTGEVVGRVARRPNAPDGAGGTLQIGGRARKQVIVSAGRVLTDASGEASPARFAARHPPSMSFELARAVAQSLGCRPKELLQRRCGARVVVVHGLGGAGKHLFRRLLESRSSAGVVHVSPVVAVLERPITAAPTPDTGDDDRFLEACEEELAKSLAVGPHHRTLPRDLRRAVVREAAGVPQLIAFLRSAVLRTDLHAETPIWWADV